LSDVITSWNQAQVTHTYSASGIYTIRISGTIIGWEFNNSGDRLKLLSISNWGPLNMNVAGSSKNFSGCSNLSDLGSVKSPVLPTDCSSMFEDCTSLTGGSSLSLFNMSNVTNTSYMFAGCSIFDATINGWNTSKVTSMSGMFLRAALFNQPIGSWNTGLVTNMSSMFEGASFFNRSLNTWNTSAVTNMANMFAAASSYNQTMISWNTSNVTTMSGMFNGATLFNQDISMWNISLVTTMVFMLISTSMSQTNYHAILTAWGDSTRATQNNVTFSIDQEFLSTNATVVARRLYLTSTKNWNIIDHGNETSMVLVWQGSRGINSFWQNEIYEIFNANGNTIEVNWGNGQNYIYSSSNSQMKGNIVPTLNTGVNYTIRITRSSGVNDILFSHRQYAYWPSGTSARPFSHGLRTVIRFGSNIRLANGGKHFYSSTFLANLSVTDAPKMPIDNSLDDCFFACTQFTGDGLINWNTNNITSMNLTFYSNYLLNFDLRSWNFTKVVSMINMLSGAYLNNPNSSTFYSNLLIHLNNNTATTNVLLGAASLTYFNQSSVINARAGLVSRGWTITDSGSV
jgi:surface protein